VDSLLPLLKGAIDPVVLFLLGWILKDVRALKKQIADLRVNVAKGEGKIELLWETGKDAPKLKQDLNVAFNEIRDLKSKQKEL